ncbi:MAG: matrixin family metalloprotease [Vampirovibrionales bacterium]|nr:matrixin family metalloprotease [Vampirovibrionales bacterium]
MDSASIAAKAYLNSPRAIMPGGGLYAKPVSPPLLHWDKSKMPITVHAVAYNGTESSILGATQEWTWASAGRIGLQIRWISEFEAAQQPWMPQAIVLDWHADPIANRPYEVGYTQLKVNPEGIIYSARISLLHQPVIDRQLGVQQQKRRIHATILHELGHALGLEHSHSPYDVMHHRGWRNTVLSNGDIAQLKQRY